MSSNMVWCQHCRAGFATPDTFEFQCPSCGMTLSNPPPVVAPRRHLTPARQSKSLDDRGVASIALGAISALAGGLGLMTANMMNHSMWTLASIGLAVGSVVFYLSSKSKPLLAAVLSVAGLCAGAAIFFTALHKQAEMQDRLQNIRDRLEHVRRK